MTTRDSPRPPRLAGDIGAGGPDTPFHGSPGGDATVDEMSEWSFPASDPPSTWTWEVPQAEDARPRDANDSQP